MLPASHRKSLLLFIAFNAITLFLAALYALSSQKEAERIIRKQLESDSFLVGEWIRGSFKSSDYVLRDIISQTDISELHYPSDDPHQHLQRKRFLEQKRATLPHTVLLGLFNKDCIITHSNSRDGFDASNRDYCQIMQKGWYPTWISQAYTANNNQLNITQLRRFESPDGQFSGMAGLAVSPLFFSDLLKSLEYSQHGIITIMDTNLILLARRPHLPEKIGQRISQKRTEDFLQTDNPVLFLDINSPVDDKRRLFIVRQFENLPFVIVIGETHDSWLRDWNQRMAILSILLILVVILATFALIKHWSLIRSLKLTQELRAEAEKLARTDMLTGISNRRDFTEQAQISFQHFKRYQTCLSVIMLDADYFKRINDTYGHHIGDQVLQHLGKILKNTLRSSDISGRIGGEEFSVFLPDTDLDHAIQLAERLRTDISTARVTSNQGEVSFTASLGVAQARSDESFHELLKRADHALYQAKASGRNRVEQNPGTEQITEQDNQ